MGSLLSSNIPCIQAKSAEVQGKKKAANTAAFIVSVTSTLRLGIEKIYMEHEICHVKQ